MTITKKEIVLLADCIKTVTQNGLSYKARLEKMLIGYDNVRPSPNGLTVWIRGQQYNLHKDILKSKTQAKK